jgi:eukaryotic-like serine/threonine-protein kinase
MDSAHWLEVDRLFQAVLDLLPDQRKDALARCSDDSLRREVETLLSFDSEPSFIDDPVFEIAARLLGEESSELAVGENFGHYKILDLIGAGGMGEVYLAHDSSLGRRVALKLLPSEFNIDDERTRRFQQEARTASALNHPNILTIYEIGRVEGRRFIATEFIEGKTLRTAIRESVVDAGTAVDIATQIAGALAAAHGAGVVHRDIKPENIMLRPDGYVKVLDFGLAKLSEGESFAGEKAAPNEEQHETRPGMLLGTVKYMSPEQARGLKVDGRSDIFSLGVLLYEVVTGRAPFEGATTSDLIASILTAEPASLNRNSPGAPVELQRIVSKALCKDREERYQSANDLLLDLKGLSQDLQLASKIQRSIDLNERSTSSRLAKYLIDRWRLSRALLTMVGLALVVAVGYGIYRFVGSQNARFRKIQMVRMTTTGRATGPTISPDGRYIAYSDAEGGKQGIWITQVATSSKQFLAPAGALPSFSPDGNYVFYLAQLSGDPTTTLYRVPVLGGGSEKVMTGVHSRAAFSPDGNRIAFVRESVKENSLMIANAGGSGERRLPAQGPLLSSGVTWSPDGRKLAFGRSGQDAEGVFFEVVEIDVGHGDERTISKREWDYIGEVEWSRDGDFLVIHADKKGEVGGIWRLAYPGGEATLIATDLNQLSNVSLTRDSSMMVSAQTISAYNIHVRSTDSPADVVRITSGSATMDGWCGIAWSSDGRIIYSSQASGRPDIWSMKPDGSDRRQVTVGLGSSYRGLSVSPDGRYIVFLSRKSGGSHVWRVDITGANPRQLTQGSGEHNPFVGPDGLWVYYHDGADRPRYSKVPIDGGEPVQLTSPFSDVVANGISPDSTLLAYRPTELPVVGKIGIASTADGKLIRILNLPRVLSWSVDGRALAFVDGRSGARNLWLQPVDGSDPTQLTYFKEDEYNIPAFSWSRDGKYLAFSHGKQSTDIVLIKSVE